MNTETFLLSLASDLQRKRLAGTFSSLAPSEKAFIFVQELEAEVNNGGFNQYFFNSAGDYAVEAVQALKAIGAHQMASFVEQAIQVFGEAGPSKIWFERQKQVLALKAEGNMKLETLDSSFCSYPDDLSQLLTDFMQKG